MPMFQQTNAFTWNKKYVQSMWSQHSHKISSGAKAVQLVGLAASIVGVGGIPENTTDLKMGFSWNLDTQSSNKLWTKELLSLQS